MAHYQREGFSGEQRKNNRLPEIFYNQYSQMSKRVGKVVGKYQLLEVLGSGAFGTVYRAKNMSNGQLFAIKAIEKQKVMGDRALSSITSEILNMMSCDHPHIATMEQAFSTKKSLYLVMELVTGMDFVDRINKKQCTENESRKYFKELCKAIKYLKERKIAHRDIKPQNILVDANDNVKLVDFGLSIFFQNSSEIFESELSTQCGTLEYLAPEIIKKEKYDPYASDVWAMGVVLYCILAGRSPFYDQNITTLMHNIINPRIEFEFECSEEYKHLIVSMLHPNPIKRPTVEAILKHKWLEGIGGQLTPLYRDTQVYPIYTEGNLSCRLMGGIQLTLALYKLALAKTMSGRRNCLLAKNTSLSHLDTILEGQGLKLAKQSNHFTYKDTVSTTIVELYRIQGPLSIFLLKIDSKQPALFERLEMLVTLSL